MRVLILACALLATSCAMLPPSQARTRAHVLAEFRPQTAHAELLAFHSAVLDQFMAGGMEVEQLAVIVHWIYVGNQILTGPHPENWEARARETWPVVRSICGPYDSLQEIVARLDSLLQ